MLPASLALVDDDAEFSEFLAQHLRDRGIAVTVFADSNDLLVSNDAYAHEFYVLDLGLPGIDGVDLVKLLRRRSQAGILVVSGRLGPDVFRDIVNAGADMHLVKPVQFEQVALAVAAVQRRAAKPAAGHAAWRLDRASGELVAPDGARVTLSEADVAVMQCLVEARGEPVTRETLLESLGRPVAAAGPAAVAGAAAAASPRADGAGPAGNEGAGPAGAAGPVDDGLNAIIYRLRRRIERATPMMVPLQSRSRVGYVFKAPLVE
jgi:two-component system, OmpR family, response regulator